MASYPTPTTLTPTTLTPAQEEAMIALAEARAIKNWKERHPAQSEAESQLTELGLQVSWRSHLLGQGHHPTPYTLGGKEVLVDNDGTAWVPITDREDGNSAGVYAPVGKIEGPGPLIPTKLWGPTCQIGHGQCDCGYGWGDRIPLWGSREHQLQARREALEALKAELEG